MRQALVVDDEADAREFVRAILEPEGWQVDEAADGPAGIALAKSLAPDLIVLDVEMPGRNGFEVFSELRASPETADAKIVMLTGVADKLGIRFSGQDMGEFFGKEPDAYCEKPIDPDVFKRIVKGVAGEA